MTRQTISKWELDKSYPDLESLIRLSDLFAVSTNFCLTLVKKMPATKPIWWMWFYRRKQSMAKVKWYAGGQERAQVAVGLLVELVKNLIAPNERPLQ